jgi:hypothetical protein
VEFLMAVGDVVNGTAAANTQITFQPAASVEVIILSCFVKSGTTYITDGVNNSAWDSGANTQTLTKIAINNTVYLIVGAATGQSGAYTGIQIK